MRVWNLPAQPVHGVVNSVLGVAVLSLMFLSVAIWNGFPLIFYDTSGYVLEGLGHLFLVERAPVYAELLFLAGARFSLWPVVILQSAITSYLILEVARAEVPKLTLGGLIGIGGALALFTGIAWYVGQVEPDTFTPVVILGAYLLLFCRLGKAQLRWITGLTGLAVACHPSHLGLLGGLLIAAAVFKSVATRFLRRARAGEADPRLPHIDIRRGLSGLAAALCLIVAGNFVMTGKLFISKSGSVFIFARVMQDGIVQRLMDDTCPPQGEIHWRLCAFKNKLPKSANAWLWGEGSGFHALGGFASQTQQDEDRSMLVESLKRYPVQHLRAAVTESLLQFFAFKTGDGIEPQLSIAVPNFRRVIPEQIPSYRLARQQRGRFRFDILNLIHVPVGAMSILGLALLLQRARRNWHQGSLPALVLLALIGNAIICGTFSNPHDRYQSRIIWLPSLVLLLAVARDRRILQPVPEAQS
ncbi:MAG TPA: hypothetical protein VLL04_07425 [Rhizomicrobium sp.]|nr:hypothetical protein [Rhizomicrobium sp.]